MFVLPWDLETGLYPNFSTGISLPTLLATREPSRSFPVTSPADVATEGHHYEKIPRGQILGENYDPVFDASRNTVYSALDRFFSSNSLSCEQTLSQNKLVTLINRTDEHAPRQSGPPAQHRFGSTRSLAHH
jgi:hypothetical protein